MKNWGTLYTCTHVWVLLNMDDEAQDMSASNGGYTHKCKYCGKLHKEEW